MRLERFNGERWYIDDRPVWRRVIRWAVWLGGWEAHRKSGYWTRRQRLRMLTPVSLLGHRVTIYGWGAEWRVKGGRWVYIKGTDRREPVVYWTRGTREEATVWLRGRPSA